jgi:large subunit ribosomal protein L10
MQVTGGNMALNRGEKEAVVKEVSAIAADARSVVVAEYLGLNVEDMTKLRRAALEKGVTIKVVKNTLAKMAFSGTRYSCMNEVLVGPLVLAFSQDSLSGAARVMREFAKDHDQIKVVGLSLGDELMGAGQLKAVASLPNYEEALAMLLGAMKAPVEKLVRTLAEPAAKVTRVTAAVRDQKQAA